MRWWRLVYRALHSHNCIISIRKYLAGVSRQLWKSGGALRPYFEDVVGIVKNAASLVPGSDDGGSDDDDNDDDGYNDDEDRAKVEEFTDGGYI